MYYPLLIAFCVVLGSIVLADAAPETLSDDAYRLRLVQWLHKDDFDDADASFPFGQPDRTAKVLVEILRHPEGFNVYPLSNAIGLVAGLQNHVPKESTDLLREAISPYLLEDQWRLRAVATSTLGRLGRADDLSLVTVMLSDQIYQVRLAAVVAIGEIGGRQALLALDIWERRQAELDKTRPEDKQWLNPAIRQALEVARHQERAKPPSTQPVIRGAGE